jgi:hypothetical protein
MTDTRLPGWTELRAWISGKTLAILTTAVGLVVIATVVAALGAMWLAVGTLGLLQIMLLAFMLIEGPAADSAKRIDALSARLMATVETERLDARDRHRELLDAIRGADSTADRPAKQD